MGRKPVVMKSRENYCSLRLMIWTLCLEYCESPLNHEGSGCSNIILVLILAYKAGSYFLKVQKV